MERLNDDELISVAKKVAMFSTHQIRDLLFTSKDLARICKLPVVLRALPPDYVDWLNKDDVTEDQANFLNMMVESAHADYCILRTVILMFDPEPNVAEVHRVLTLASIAKVESVDYFLAMLDASAEGGDNIENVISTFTKLFRAQKLHAL
jgi:hypothetical protein